MSDCDKCHGRGWWHDFYGEEDQWGVRDYREAYCDCEAGERLREQDNGKPTPEADRPQ